MRDDKHCPKFFFVLNSNTFDYHKNCQELSVIRMVICLGRQPHIHWYLYTSFERFWIIKPMKNCNSSYSENSESGKNPAVTSYAEIIIMANSKID